MADNFIDSAMDVAEARLIPDETPTSQVVDKEVEAAEVKAFSKETQEVSKEVKEPTRNIERDDKGKFSKAQKQILSDQVAEVEEVKEELPPINPPTFWSADKKDAFVKAPREVQEAVLAYENQRNEWANRIASEAQRGKAFDKRLYEDMGNDPEAIKIHKSKLALNGVKDEVEELHRYRQWDTVFNTDPYTGIADLMKKNNLTPYDFIEGASQEAQYQTDPRIEQELEAVRQTKEEVARIKEQLELQEQTRFMSEIETFKSGKDSAGQVRKSFAEAYAPQIDQAYKYIAENNPSMSFQEALNHAYEYVLSEARKLHGVTSQPQPVVKTPEKVIATAKKAQNAASSVTGAPANGTSASRPRARTIDEALDRAEEQLRSRY